MEWLVIIYVLVFASIAAVFLVPNEKIEYRAKHKQ